MRNISIATILVTIFFLCSCSKKTTIAVQTPDTPSISTKTEVAKAPKIQSSLTHHANVTEWQQREVATYIQAFNVFEEKVFTEKDFTFYPIDPTFQVIADVTLTPDTEVFEMKTSGHRTPRYREYGTITFSVLGKPQSLTLYQNMDMLDHPEYGDYLFCPFYDKTNGDTTYGGGRYLDVKIPEGDKMLLDFNKCYNPYCAYLDKFNCPITPVDNSLTIELKVGMKLEEHH